MVELQDYKTSGSEFQALDNEALSAYKIVTKARLYPVPARDRNLPWLPIRCCYCYFDSTAATTTSSATTPATGISCTVHSQVK